VLCNNVLHIHKRRVLDEMNFEHLDGLVDGWKGWRMIYEFSSIEGTV
jgi:hypothetical protein